MQLRPALRRKPHRRWQLTSSLVDCVKVTPCRVGFAPAAHDAMYVAGTPLRVGSPHTLRVRACMGLERGSGSLKRPTFTSPEVFPKSISHRKCPSQSPITLPRTSEWIEAVLRFETRRRSPFCSCTGVRCNAHYNGQLLSSQLLPTTLHVRAKAPLKKVFILPPTPAPHRDQHPVQSTPVVRTPHSSQALDLPQKRPFILQFILSITPH